MARELRYTNQTKRNQVMSTNIVVGQVLIRVRRGGRITEHKKVTSVGSKYFYCDDNMRQKYERSTLKVVSDFGCPEFLYRSKEEYQKEIDREANITFLTRYSNFNQLTDAQISRLIAIINEGV